MSKKNKPKLLYTSSDWTLELIEKVALEVQKIAEDDLGWKVRPLQIELISSDQMLDAYSSHALPLYYNHWSFGKRHLMDEANYNKGHSGLAYEIISNVAPNCLAYLMENNTMTLQTLVLAHCQGHSYYFANNYLFKQWTQPDAIVNYMKFAKEFILKCEEKYGLKEVEAILDACHALRLNGVDKYKRPIKKSRKKQKELYEQRLKYAEEFESEIWKMVPKKETYETFTQEGELDEPEENLLYFIEKNSPTLKPWQKEIVRIVRKIAQYFAPQFQSQVSNEGAACFGHYYIMNKLFDEGKITEGNMLEFLDNHSGVIMQTLPDFRSEEQKKADAAKGKGVIPYRGINPYALGFAIMQDIKRICENPTEEDKYWFPDFAGSDWRVAIRNAICNYRDESFIRQFLSPKVIRDFKFIALNNTETNTDNMPITNIHNEQGYRNIRNTLADSYDINLKVPNIQVVRADLGGDRKLCLRHFAVNNRILDESLFEVMQHIKVLWGYSVELESLDSEGSSMEIYDTEEM